jgi:hypothetical protein
MKLRKYARVVLVAVALIVGGVSVSASPALACRADGVTGGVNGPC